MLWEFLGCRRLLRHSSHTELSDMVFRLMVMEMNTDLLSGICLVALAATVLVGKHNLDPYTGLTIDHKVSLKVE